MFRKGILLFTGLALLAVGGGLMTAQDKTAQDKAAQDKTEPDKTVKDPKREADKLVIDKLTNESIQAFINRDAAAIAAHWTDDGEFTRNDGEAIRGRSNIQKGYAEYFKSLKGKP